MQPNHKMGSCTWNLLCSSLKFFPWCTLSQMYHTSWDCRENTPRICQVCSSKSYTCNFIIRDDCILPVWVMFIISCCGTSWKDWICLYASGLGLLPILVVDFYFGWYKCEKDCHLIVLCLTKYRQAVSFEDKPCMFLSPTNSSFFPYFWLSSAWKKRWALNEPWRSVDSGCFIPARE